MPGGEKAGGGGGGGGGLAGELSGFKIDPKTRPGKKKPFKGLFVGPAFFLLFLGPFKGFSDIFRNSFKGFF